MPIRALRPRLPIGTKGGSKERVYLEDHLNAVEAATEVTCAHLPANLRSALKTAAHLHDYGKADIRYQAWLRGGDLLSARYAPKTIAKSGKDVLRPQQAVGLPQGFRHEILSLILAEKSPRLSEAQRDLVLHLIASHHGRCRPLAPVIIDSDAGCASYNGIDVCAEERLERTPHRIGNGVPDRFWKLTARYGWWGIAYLEALLRLADWRASTEEAAEVE
ncbi:MAG: CRISPR-associated endonuclease Cas3'' [Acidobacteriaceae bacterium]